MRTNKCGYQSSIARWSVLCCDVLSVLLWENGSCANRENYTSLNPRKSNALYQLNISLLDCKYIFLSKIKNLQILVYYLHSCIIKIKFKDERTKSAMRHPTQLSSLRTGDLFLSSLCALRASIPNISSLCEKQCLNIRSFSFYSRQRHGRSTVLFALAQFSKYSLELASEAARRWPPDGCYTQRRW